MSHILLTIVFLKLIYIFVCRKKVAYLKKKARLKYSQLLMPEIDYKFGK